VTEEPGDPTPVAGARPQGFWEQSSADFWCDLLAAVFALATFVLWIVVADVIWDGDYQSLSVIGAGVLCAGIAVWLYWQRKRGESTLLAWFRRRRGWLLTAWGLLLVSVVTWLVVRDQIRTRENACFCWVMDRVRANKELAQRLGSPIRAGWWVSGSAPLSKAGEFWHFEFAISGPKGSARVWADKELSNPLDSKQTEKLFVTIDSTGERIDLTEPQPSVKAL
jgi:hypothetical protein